MTGKIILTSAGILLMIYGALVAAVGSGTRFFLVWFALGGLCLAAAAALALGWFALLPSAVRAVLAFIVISLALVLTVCVILIGTRFHARAEKGLPFIIVLGAQVREDGPSRVLRYRLDTAAAYLKENEDALCIVSGGQGYNEPVTEAEGMRVYLEAAGIDPSRIICEDKSENTAQNIVYSMAAAGGLEGVSAGLVTNDFHMYRALEIARAKGLADAQGIAAPSSPFYLPNNVLRECLGILKDAAVGNIWRKEKQAAE